VQQTQTELEKGVSAIRGGGVAESKQQARDDTVISNSFEVLLRKAAALGEALSEADREAHRKAIKQQDNMFKLKLESSRTAGAVNLQNAQTELQAAYHKQLEDQVKAIKSGGSSALADAHRELEECQEDLRECELELTKQTSLNTSLRGVLASKDTEQQAMRQQAQDDADKLEKMGGEVSTLREQLKFAAAAAKSAAERVDKELKSRVSEAEARMRADIEAARAQASSAGTGSAALKEERDRLQATLEEARRQHQIEMDAAAKLQQQLSTELEAAKSQLGEMTAESAAAASEGGDAAATAAVARKAAAAAERKAAAEIAALNEELQRLQEQLAAKGEVAEEAVFKADASSRRLLESRAKTAASVRSATSFDDAECKRRVDQLAEELEMEMDVASDEELEQAKEQLSRLLDELSKMRIKEGQLEAKLMATNEEGNKMHQLRQQIERMERDQRRASTHLVQALSEVRVPVEPSAGLFTNHIPLALKHFHALFVENANTRNMLDASLAELGLGRDLDEDATLSEKLLALLQECRGLRKDTEKLKGSLDAALAEIEQRQTSSGSKARDRADLHTRMQALMVAARKILERERVLKETVKKQHSSLHHAYQRCKEVEMELARSQGSAAEQREALVGSALHALQQLRHHLGAIHALRPEAAKPLDDALNVKSAIYESTRSPSPQRAGSAHTRVQANEAPLQGVDTVTGGGYWLGSGLPPREAMMRPSTGMMESFLQRIADESALIVSGSLPGEWAQSDSRPKTEMRGFSSPGGMHDSLYNLTQQSPPSGATRRPWTTAKPLTPLGVAFERDRAGYTLRVPQPGSKPSLLGSPSHPDLPSASLLTSYATIKSHLSAARSLANL